MKREEQALEIFKNGFTCAQSVFVVFAKEHGLDEATAFKIAGGFGSGMGRLQETCGAVAGAFMAIGLQNGKTLGDEGTEKRDKTYALVREFNTTFKEKFSATTCRNLLQCDLTTPEGIKYFADNNLHDKVCVQCVQEAVRIVEKIL
jgi:C_GCAxxG_C_C family probable redox protein